MFRIALVGVVAMLVVPSVASAQKLSRTEVKAMQRALGVRADGAVGPKTRRAIRRFERRNDLEVDGRPDPELLEELGVTTEDEADEPAAVEPTGTSPPPSRPPSRPSAPPTRPPAPTRAASTAPA